MSGSRILRRTGVVLVALGMLAATAGCLVDENTFIDRTNATRAGRGLAPLTPNLALWLKAGGWSLKMAADGKLSHSALAADNPLPWKQLGENVAHAATLDQAYQLFLDSKEHLDNIVHPQFNYIGVGIVKQDGTYWVTQEFMYL